MGYVPCIDYGLRVTVGDHDLVNLMATACHLVENALSATFKCGNRFSIISGYDRNFHRTVTN